MSTIRFEEAIDLIDSGAVVSLKYVSYDHKRKNGGVIKTLDEAVVTKQKSIRKSEAPKTAAKSNHYENSTRNLFVCIEGKPTSAVRTIHLYLLLFVNGKKVML